MSLGNALGHLTLLPFPYKKHVPLLRSIHYFPLVGAGMGSIAVLFFLGVRHIFPGALSCFLTVAVLEVLSGGAPLRGIVEMTQGRRTYPGHGFEPGFKPDQRGIGIAGMLLFFKTTALILLPTREWQTHAVFVLPILGHCAQTLALVMGPCRIPRGFLNDKLIARRRVRAGFISVLLLALLFLFPWRAAIPALALFLVIVFWGNRLLHAFFQGLTLQAVSLLAELSETAVLILLAVAARTWA